MPPETQEELLAEFESLAKPLMEFLCKNCNPHSTIIITQTDAELLSGEMAIATEEFLRD